jgi:hypothetical protein
MRRATGSIAMPRTPAKVTQADIARALRAAEQSGAQRVIEIAPDGTIRLVPHEKRDAMPEQAPPVAEKPRTIL